MESSRVTRTISPAFASVLSAVADVTSTLASEAFGGGGWGSSRSGHGRSRYGGGSGGIGRHLVAPPGLPADVVTMLRDGFMATMRDPEFLADAARSNLPVVPLDGASLQKIVADVTATPAPVIARAKELLGGG